MPKLNNFFVLYKDTDSKLLHAIEQGFNKKIVVDSYRDKGYTPKAIFSVKDIEDVKNNAFSNKNVTDLQLNYLKEHLNEWEHSQRKGEHDG